MTAAGEACLVATLRGLALLAGLGAAGLLSAPPAGGQLIPTTAPPTTAPTTTVTATTVPATTVPSVIPTVTLVPAPTTVPRPRTTTTSSTTPEDTTTTEVAPTSAPPPSAPPGTATAGTAPADTVPPGTTFELTDVGKASYPWFPVLATIGGFGLALGMLVGPSLARRASAWT
ncbi:MAG: hypothetical protein ACRD0N_06345, partial [Acidimicrobiales bacterium]